MKKTLTALGLKPLLAFGLNSAKVGAGIAQYLVKGTTPEYAYQAMIGLYCATRGWSNDVLSALVSAVRRPYRLADRSGILGNLDDARLQRVVGELETRGFYQFEERLPDALCDRLTELARTQPCRVRPLDSDPGAPEMIAKYDENKPIGVRYDVLEQSLLDAPVVQELISDYSLLTVAQAYLGAPPILDIVAMWWHTAFSREPQKRSAQYYHFDMDRLKWLKFFVLLTDVTTDSGPHCYVAGSHRRGGTPRALLQHGYARLPDEEVRRHFRDQDFIEFTGPRGTIVAEDTRGLHKGKHVRSGHRLMFEIEFTNSLFGGAHLPDRITQMQSPRLAELARKHPRLYGLFA
jgi:hypothetical protein